MLRLEKKEKVLTSVMFRFDGKFYHTTNDLKTNYPLKFSAFLMYVPKAFQTYDSTQTQTL
jgi:hypothetical protein